MTKALTDHANTVIKGAQDKLRLRKEGDKFKGGHKRKAINLRAGGLTGRTRIGATKGEAGSKTPNDEDAPPCRRGRDCDGR